MVGFDLVDRYFWLVFIAVTAINASLLKARAARHIAQDPDLAPGYETLIRGYLIWLNIPWLVMGAGILLGGVPSIAYYLRPQDGNAWVLAFVATVVTLWVVGTAWLFFQGGAELIATHPGVPQFGITNPTLVKLYWLFCLAGGVAGLYLMWTGDVPLPPLR